MAGRSGEHVVHNIADNLDAPEHGGHGRGDLLDPQVVPIDQALLLRWLFEFLRELAEAVRHVVLVSHRELDALQDLPRLRQSPLAGIVERLGPLDMVLVYRDVPGVHEPGTDHTADVVAVNYVLLHDLIS